MQMKLPVPLRVTGYLYNLMESKIPPKQKTISRIYPQAILSCGFLRRRIKIFQLNIFKGLYLDRIISYLQQNHFDILCLQEVTGGELGKDNSRDCFKELKTGLNYYGELSCDLQNPHDPKSYFGNAIFFHKNYQINNLKTIYAEQNRIVDYQKIITTPNWAMIPRHCLVLKMQINNIDISILTAHAPWSKYPTDSPEKIEFAKEITTYLQTLKEPFVLTGDFNMQSSSQTIQIINKVSNNLIDEYKVTNTLNSHIHYAAKEIFPAGLAVDYIFTSKDMKINDFKVIDTLDLSDHYGLAVEIDLT